VGIGCGDEHAEEAVPAGVDPAALEIRPAEVVGDPPCDRKDAGELIVKDVEGGTCLELGEAVVDASMVDSAEITEGLHGPVVAIEQLRVAERTCEAYRPPGSRDLEVVGISPTTMEEQNDLLHRTGQLATDSLPGTSADTPIALCSYRLSPHVVPPTPPSTTICPDGSILDMTAPLLYLVAEYGSAIEDPQGYSVLGGPSCG
jgi:hypothetical protein